MSKTETIMLGTDDESLLYGAKLIKEGGLVAFPTETVYGLGADGLNAAAVSNLDVAKGRPSDNPMILHISSKDDLGMLTETLTEDMELLMEAFWPGPVTMVVKAKDIVPKVTTGGLDTVAVRMPSEPVALRLIEAAGVPLAAPSANTSGKPSPTTAIHVLDDLNGKIEAVIMGGECTIGIESTVIDMTGQVPTILRPGMVTATDLAKVLGKEIAVDQALLNQPEVRSSEGLMETGENYKPKSPGMKYKQYAQSAEMIIFKGEPEKVRLAIAEAKMVRTEQGQKVGVMIYDGDAENAAHDFFSKLRAFD